MNTLNSNMVGDKVALKIKEADFGKINIVTDTGNLELQIDIGFERAHYQTQYSEVVGVPLNEKEIKVGMMVFHNHNVFSEGRYIEKDTYWTPREFIYGTEQGMFGDNVMVERLYEGGEVVLGSVFSPTISQHKVLIKNKCRVLTGKYAGKIMYCTHLMFYEIVGYSRKICIAKEDQLICDEQMNPVKDKIIIKPHEVELVKRKSGIIVASDWKHPKMKRGTVLKAEDASVIGKEVGYSRPEKFELNGELYHAVLSHNIECIIDEPITDLVPL